jgi:hypothetical protein
LPPLHRPLKHRSTSHNKNKSHGNRQPGATLSSKSYHTQEPSSHHWHRQAIMCNYLRKYNRCKDCQSAVLMEQITPLPCFLVSPEFEQAAFGQCTHCQVWTPTVDGQLLLSYRIDPVDEWYHVEGTVQCRECAGANGGGYLRMWERGT